MLKATVIRSVALRSAAPSASDRTETPKDFRFWLDDEFAIEAGGALDHVGVDVGARVEELDRAAASLRRHAGIIHAG